MELNVKIDFDDLWCDEDTSISESLQKKVLGYVRSQLVTKIMEANREAINRFVKEYTETKLHQAIDKYIDDGIADNKPIFARWGGNPQTLPEIIKGYLNDGGKEREIKQHLDKSVSNSINALKERYDIYFAAQVVKKMAKMDMLKEEKMRLLLDDMESK